MPHFIYNMAHYNTQHTMMVLKKYDKVAMFHNHEDNTRPALLNPTKTAKTSDPASNRFTKYLLGLLQKYPTFEYC